MLLDIQLFISGFSGEGIPRVSNSQTGYIGSSDS